jgi:hypothetical protein
MPKHDMHEKAGIAVIKLKKLLAQIELQKHQENKLISKMLKGGIIK